MTKLAPKSPAVLAVNGGSSGVKFALFEVHDPARALMRGAIEGTDPAEAADVLQQRIGQCIDGDSLLAIGHRVVHGGTAYVRPQRIDDVMLAQLRRLSPFDPGHLPGEILLIETLARKFPGVPQVACFDTAFHHDLPRVAHMLPIPRRYHAQGVRRYGFHGLSYEFLMAELARVAGAQAAQGRVILAHLGSGASLAAVRRGAPVDTSMSFTPAAGLPMSTRAGDLDPGLAGYLARTEKMSALDFSEMIYRQSGLLGISETSGNIRELLEIEAADVRAAEAVALFCYQVRKWIGAFAAVLGGVDTVIFAGGIGENQPQIRARICEGLEFLGIVLDGASNAAGEALISAATARVAVRVMRTDEEQVVARATCRELDL